MSLKRTYKTVKMFFSFGSNKEQKMENKILAGHLKGEIRIVVPRRGAEDPLEKAAEPIVDLLEKDVVSQEKELSAKAVAHLWCVLAALEKSRLLPNEENIFSHAIMKSKHYEGSFGLKLYDRMMVSAEAEVDEELTGTFVHNIQDPQSNIKIYIQLSYAISFVSDNKEKAEQSGYQNISISKSEVFKNFYKKF